RAGIVVEDVDHGVGGRILIYFTEVPGHGGAKRAAVIPAQLAAQVPRIVAALASGVLIAGSREQLPRIVVAGIAGVGHSLLITFAVEHAERERARETLRDRQLDHAADLHAVVAADGHVAGDAELVAGGAGDDRDCAADRIASKQRALRALQHLDALDVEQVLVRPDRAAEIDPIEVDADRRVDVEREVTRSDAADRRAEHGARSGEGRRGVEGDVRSNARKGRDVADRAFLQRLGVERADCDRYVLHVLGALLRGYDNLLDAAGRRGAGVLILCDGRRGQSTCQSGK